GQAVAAIIGFLKDPANQRQLANKLLDYMDMLLSRSVGDVIAFIGRENLEEASQWAVDNMVSMRSADALMDSLDRFLRSDGDRTWRELFLSLRHHDNGAPPDGAAEERAADGVPVEAAPGAPDAAPLANHRAEERAQE